MSGLEPHYRRNPKQTLSLDEVKHHVERILRMEVGDRYAVEEFEAPEILRALKLTPLGGRRFRTYKSPDSFRVTILRDRDATQESLISEQHRARAAMQRAKADADRQLAAMKNAATMSQFESDQELRRAQVKPAKEVTVEDQEPDLKSDGKKYYDHKGNLLDHKPTLREKLSYSLLKTPFFKEGK